MEESEINLNKMKEELRILNEKSYISLSNEDHILEQALISLQKDTLYELKDYIKILATIIATVIPFSSLIFTIDKTILEPNVYVWVFSLLCFISALFILLFSYFFEYLNTLQKRIIKHRLYYDRLDMLDYELNKDDQEKVSENAISLANHYEKQFSLRNELSNGLFELKLLLSLRKKLQQALYLFFTGFMFLFISIFYEKLAIIYHPITLKIYSYSYHIINML